MLGLCMIPIIGGIVLLCLRTKKNYDWDTASYLKHRKAHMVFGYIVILYGQVVIIFGLLMFAQGDYAYLIAINLALIVLVLGISEYSYRKKWYEVDAFRPAPAKMKLDEFNRAVAAGRKFVILDEMVLNVEGFINHHPGGRFVL